MSELDNNQHELDLIEAGLHRVLGERMIGGRLKLQQHLQENGFISTLQSPRLLAVSHLFGELIAMGKNLLLKDPDNTTSDDYVWSNHYGPALVVVSHTICYQSGVYAVAKRLEKDAETAWLTQSTTGIEEVIASKSFSGVNRLGNDLASIDQAMRLIANGGSVITSLDRPDLWPSNGNYVNAQFTNKKVAIWTNTISAALEAGTPIISVIPMLVDGRVITKSVYLGDEDATSVAHQIMEHNESHLASNVGFHNISGPQIQHTLGLL